MPELDVPGDAWLVVIDPQRIFADPASDWGSPMFAGIGLVVDDLVERFADRVIVTRWLPGTNRNGSWRDYFDRWPFADRPDRDPMFHLVDAANGWVRGSTLDVSTFGKWPALQARTGPNPHLVLTGVSTDCCVISTALAAADAGATITVIADGCAGSTHENHAAALQVMGLYEPQIRVI